MQNDSTGGNSGITDFGTFATGGTSEIGTGGATAAGAPIPTSLVGEWSALDSSGGTVYFLNADGSYICVVNFTYATCSYTDLQVTTQGTFTAVGRTITFAASTSTQQSKPSCTSSWSGSQALTAKTAIDIWRLQVDGSGVTSLCLTNVDASVSTSEYCFRKST